VAFCREVKNYDLPFGPKRDHVTEFSISTHTSPAGTDDRDIRAFDKGVALNVDVSSRSSLFRPANQPGITSLLKPRALIVSWRPELSYTAHHYRG
jgi:hypothetical protein